MMNIIACGQHILEQEIESLKKLRPNFNADFEKVVNLIFKSTGKLVLSGVGKSAHIAHKIVATLNSTGTYACFLHATEALHGDLGMIQPNDVIFIISKSGESFEIVDLLLALKNFSNPIVAMVGNIHSTLAKHAHFVLNTHVVKEADPNNLAPTNSTTCQLVMGDALALCVMQKKKFTAQHFAKFHPGGALGKQLLLRVKEVLHHNPHMPKVFENDTLKHVVVNISQGRMGATAVINKKNKVVGIITDGDIRRMLDKKYSLDKDMATKVMTRHPKTISENMLLSDALKILNQFNISQLIVINAQKEYVGIIHLHEILKEGIQ